MTKLIETKSGRHTALKIGTEDDSEELRKAQNRIVGRLYPGHFANPNQGSRDGMRHIEVCRAVGCMTEHTGIFLEFAVITDSTERNL